MAILRQGEPTIPVTAMVPTGCPIINGATQFNFVILPTDSWHRLQTPPMGRSRWPTAAPHGISLPFTINAGRRRCSKQWSHIAAWNLRSDRRWNLCVCAVGHPTLTLPKTIAVGPSGF